MILFHGLSWEAVDLETGDGESDNFPINYVSAWDGFLRIKVHKGRWFQSIAIIFRLKCDWTLNLLFESLFLL